MPGNMVLLGQSDPKGGTGNIYQVRANFREFRETIPFGIASLMNRSPLMRRMNNEISKTSR